MTPNHDGEAPVLELNVIWSTPSLLLLPGLLWPGLVVPVSVPSIAQIELFNPLLNLKPFMLNRDTSVKLRYLKPINCVPIKLLVFDSNSWNHLTLCKLMNSGSFKNNVTYKGIRLHIYIIYICIKMIWHRITYKLLMWRKTTNVHTIPAALSKNKSKFGTNS